MANLERRTGNKEPGVRSPGIREIEIEKLNPRQMAQLMGWDYAHIPYIGENSPEQWRFTFLHENENTMCNLLISPLRRSLDLNINNNSKVLSIVGLRNVDTVDLLNFKGKRVIFKGDPGRYLIITENGCISGEGLKFLS